MTTQHIYAARSETIYHATITHDKLRRGISDPAKTHQSVPEMPSKLHVGYKKKAPKIAALILGRNVNE